MNYFIYPMKYMRITQSYNGTISHKLHWYNAKDYKDYPIDDGGKDKTRDGIYCPCDEMKVTRIKGVGNNKITNTIWLVSTSKVKTPTFNDYAFMALTHSNDIDFKDIKVGKIFKRGDLIVKEGENINVSTHIHMSFGRGSSNDWIYNSNDKLVIKGDTKKPEEVCYIDKDFTVIKNDGGIKWVNKPVYLGSPVKKNDSLNQIQINTTDLRARKTPNGEILGYVNKGIYNIIEKTSEKSYTWYKVENFWVAYSKDWAKVFLKRDDTQIIEQDKEEVVTENVKENKKSIWIRIIEFFKKIFGL